MAATKPRAALDARLEHLAQTFTSKVWSTDVTEPPGHLLDFLRDHAASLGEFAEQLRNEYVRVVPATGATPTPAQGVAITGLLRAYRSTRADVTVEPDGLRPGEIGVDVYVSRQGEQAANTPDRITLMAAVDRAGQVCM